VRNSSHESGLVRNSSHESLPKLRRSGSPNALVRSNSGMSAATLSDHSDHPDKNLARTDLVSRRLDVCLSSLFSSLHLPPLSPLRLSVIGALSSD
jgi:hypothetical protein